MYNGHNTGNISKTKPKTGYNVEYYGTAQLFETEAMFKSL